jgi:hypothetical protein
VPQDSKALQQKWTARITHARAHWANFHKRVRHSRNTVAGFNWNADPTSKDFYSLRANLIHGTISAVLPNVYARNPEISTTPTHSGADIKLFCKTLEKVTNRALEHAQLKNRAKSTVRAALTCTGAPDGMEDKESWLKVLPMITNLSIQMQNLQARGMDYEHIRNLLHETLLRYDDRIDSNLFIPNVEKQAEGWLRDDDPNSGMNWFSERRQKTNAGMNYGSNLLKEETGNDASSK